MSVFGDFQQVWLQRFPQSDLPARWEEDVRANLAKHKQKVKTLKEELEKEEVYVEYLERLISDIEEHKKKIEIEKSENEGNVLEKKDVTSDNISKVNIYYLQKDVYLENTEYPFFACIYILSSVSWREKQRSLIPEYSRILIDFYYITLLEIWYMNHTLQHAEYINCLLL